MDKGTIFDLDETKGDWFDFFESTIDIKTGDITYDDPKPGTGRVCLRNMSVFVRERNRNRKKKYEFVLNSSTRSMQKVESTEQTAEEEAQERDDAFDYAITHFENFFDAKGKTIECIRENKIKLLAIPVFDRFIARCFELQQNANKMQSQVIEKNSSTP